MKEGKLEEALALELEYSAADPTNVQAHRTLSAIYARLGRVEEALAEATKALDLAPDDPVAHFNMGSILYKSAQFARALDEYRKASELGMKGADAKIGEALALVQLGQPGDAAALLEKVTAEDEKNKEAWVALGWAYIYYRDGKGSKLAADRALALAPRDFAANRLLGEVHLRNGFLYRAIQSADRLIELEPKNPSGYIFMGQLTYKESGEAEKAGELLKKAQANLPDNYGLMIHLAEGLTGKAKAAGALVNLDERKKEKIWYGLAEKAYMQALEARPDDPQACMGLAEVLIVQRKYQPALKYATTARQGLPHDAKARQVYEKARLAANDLAGALKAAFRRDGTN